MVPDWLAEHARALAEVDTSLGGISPFTAEHAPAGAPENTDPPGSTPTAEGDLPSLSAGNFAIHREVFLAIGGFDESYSGGTEDGDLGWRLHRAGFTSKHIPAASTHYRMRSGSRALYRQQMHYSQMTRLHHLRFAEIVPPDGGWIDLALGTGKALGRFALSTARRRPATRRLMNDLGWRTGHLRALLAYRGGRLPARQLIDDPATCGSSIASPRPVGGTRAVMLSAYFPPTAGGVESVGAFLCDFLGRSGLSVTVLTTTQQQMPDEASLPYRILRAPSAAQRWRAIRGADVAIFNSPMLGWAPMVPLLRKPTLTIIHGWIRDPEGPRLQGIAPGLTGKIQRTKLEVGDRLREQLWRSGTRVVSVSRDAAEHTGADATVIHNSYRSDIFHETTLPAQRPVGSIVFVGRLVRGKGAEVLLDALALARRELPDLQAVIVGDGAQRASLEQQVADLGLGEHVRFTGELSPDKVNEALNDSRIAVVPSTLNEAFGVVAIEAQAAGCAVIAADAPGLREAVGEGGVLVRQGDASALAAEILRVSRDTDLWASLVEASRAGARALRPEVLLPRYLEIIEELARR